MGQDLQKLGKKWEGKVGRHGNTSETGWGWGVPGWSLAVRGYLTTMFPFQGKGCNWGPERLEDRQQPYSPSDPWVGQESLRCWSGFLG